MSETRSQFLDVLNKLPSQTLEKISKNLEQNIAITRIFDDCASFLTTDELESYSSLFKKIILSIDSTTYSNHGYQLIKSNDKTMIESFECGIIRIARRELLDDKGALKPAISSLLKLTRPLTQTETTDFVCAYVSTINQDIVCELNQDKNVASKEQNPQLGAAFNYINTNYHQWIRDVLKQTCHFISSQTPVHTQSMFASSYNNNTMKTIAPANRTSTPDAQHTHSRNNTGL